MEREIIDKCLKYFGLLIFVSSLIELIIAIILSFIPITINSEIMSLLTFILSANFKFTGIVCWFLTIITPFFYMALGLGLYYIVTKKQINIEYLSKYMIVFGMILMIGAFLKLEYQYLLQNQIAVIGIESRLFLYVLIDFSITPFSVVVLWTILTSIYCGNTVLAIVIAAGGLNKSLKIEREQENKVKNLSSKIL